jgi:hypothetical protein
VCVGEIAFKEVLPGFSYMRVSLPVGIWFPLDPFAPVVALSKFLQQTFPWPYIYLSPIYF